MSDDERILSDIRRIAKEMRPPSRTELERLHGWLEHSSPFVRAAAADATRFRLTNIRSEMVAALLSHARTDPSFVVKEACLDALGHVGMAYQELAEETGRPPDFQRDCPPPYRELRDLLMTVAQDKTQPESLRKVAILELGCLSDDPVAQQPLHAFLDDPSSVLRAAAAQGVGSRSAACEFEDKLLALFDDPDEDVERAAMLSCGKLAFPSALNRLRDLCSSPNPRIRGTAWISFAACGPIEEVEDLLPELAGTVADDDPLAEDLAEAHYQLSMRLPEDEELDDHYFGGGDEDDYAATEDIAEDFVVHEGGKALDEPQQAELRLEADTFQGFVVHYLGIEMEELTKENVREYLLDYFPQEVRVVPEDITVVPAHLARFLRFLASEAVVDHGNELATYAINLQSAFESAMRQAYEGNTPRGLGTGMGNDEPTPPLKAQSKVSRNAPCPCGSGKKFKKCCGR